MVKKHTVLRKIKSFHIGDERRSVLLTNRQTAMILYFDRISLILGKGQGKGKGKGQCKGEGVLFRILQIILRILGNHILNNLKKINFSLHLIFLYLVKMNKIMMIHFEGGSKSQKESNVKTIFILSSFCQFFIHFDKYLLSKYLTKQWVQV